MTDIDWEATKRAEKVERLSTFLRSLHDSLPPRLPIVAWATQPHLPWSSLERAAGVRPCSPISKEMVLDALRGES